MRRMVAWTQRIRRPLFAVSSVLLAAGTILCASGSATLGGLLYTVGSLTILPVAALAAATPRPGLVWYGGYAEPWRTERSSGEPEHLAAEHWL